MLQKGPQTEGDAQRAMRTLPRMENTVLSNRYILQMKKAINDRAIDRAKFLEEYRRTHNGMPIGFRSEWYKSDVGKQSIFQRIAESDPTLFHDLRKANVFSQEVYEEIIEAIK